MPTEVEAHRSAPGDFSKVEAPRPSPGNHSEVKALPMVVEAPRPSAGAPFPAPKTPPIEIEAPSPFLGDLSEIEAPLPAPGDLSEVEAPRPSAGAPFPAPETPPIEIEAPSPFLGDLSEIEALLPAPGDLSEVEAPRPSAGAPFPAPETPPIEIEAPPPFPGDISEVEALLPGPGDLGECFVDVEAPGPAPEPRDLREAMSRCLALRHHLLHSGLAPSSYHSLLRRIDEQVRPLSRLPPPPPSGCHIAHLECVARLLLHPSIRCISRIDKPLPIPPLPGAEHPVRIDLVCTFRRRPAWFLLSSGHPARLSWIGNKGLRMRVKHVTSAAHSARCLKPASVFFVFFRGVRAIVAANLVDDFGAVEVDLFKDEEELEDRWTGVRWPDTGKFRVFEIRISTDNEKDDAVCSMKTVDVRTEIGGLNDGFGSLISKLNMASADVLNFDTTSLITMVSGISNGDCDRLLKVPEAEMRARFKGHIYELVMAQITSELQNPILPQIADAIAGKKGIICESVHSRFQELVRTCGGPNERFRAGQLIKLLQVVPDSPSERVMDLPIRGKITLRSKIVFGTGDHWQAPTLTSNTGFIRAVSETSMPLPTVEHSYRYLSGY